VGPNQSIEGGQIKVSKSPLNSFDREVLAAIADEPFADLFDAYGYPRNDVAAKIAVKIGRDPTDYFETYQALKVLRIRLLDAQRKQGVTK